ncbi:hypothetical protein M011DRAFT_471039 [Sporormia fimetaria CBS 119925]|uniref:Uncharacterized protein n=1 Tax=Sporormia fimetaria CBS 119925 TaxID=1340428 RepID=A0A6A6V2F5_9PLEO|nr:hypothetical protein M011DRAFT_471039 [Sporormia fimetaria CBS 119925]
MLHVLRPHPASTPAVYGCANNKAITPLAGSDLRHVLNILPDNELWVVNIPVTDPEATTHQAFPITVTTKCGAEQSGPSSNVPTVRSWAGRLLRG